MKWLLSFFLFLLFHQADAQKLTGIVKDFNTRLPIVHVKVYSVKQATSTGYGGKFTIEKLTKGDHLSFRLKGYQTVEFVFGGTTDTIIFLQSISAGSKVQAKRNPQSTLLKEENNSFIKHFFLKGIIGEITRLNRRFPNYFY